ncbi:MAG TPA: hypothetical protein VEK11_10715 [Thermoanaerobaculia bacterium]|nr:hypothetical protein [Thermoanaerobaculia bacterium]
MTHDRLPGRRLPDDEIERIANEYRYKGGEQWGQAANALTDFTHLYLYGVETDRLKVRLDSGVQDLPHRQRSTTQYDRERKRLAVVVDQNVHEGLALMRTDAAFAYFVEVANILLACDEIGERIPELREDALATIGDRPRHPQAQALAAAIMIPLPWLVVAARGRTLTAAYVARQLGAPLFVAERRLAQRRRWSDSAIEKMMSKRSPVRLEVNLESRRKKQTIRLFEEAVRRRKQTTNETDAEQPKNGT